ncbi:MAG TPA: methylmalonyl Co-A mutase-associated GTPase MeaB [Thermohalobaculum sp.]|nr:methylmalonyl Co-A mutase-associated GTPase MeaB [Thermohalobaculum sp.]
MTTPDITTPDIDDLARRLENGDRRALARAITLAESTRADHRARARALLQRIHPAGSVARRVGISGTPGVGKSSFIEALGSTLIGQGLKVAVLAVDPSSARSGGSILGDKTRMERLAREAHAFIRPSPAGAELGGVARRTREAIQIVEAAGFDVVLVETVGVGQSEAMVAEMTDVFLLLLAPGGGDELQGVKRGIVEAADLIVVNKADGEQKALARRTAADYSGALHLMRGRTGDAPGYPLAMTASALTGEGLEEVWRKLVQLDDWRRAHGVHEARRAAQARAWMRAALARGAIERLHADPRVAERIDAIEAAVSERRMAPEAAAEELLALYAGDG